MSKVQRFKVTSINHKTKTITFELIDTPTEQDGSGNSVWPDPWNGNIGRSYKLNPDGSLELIEEGEQK